MIKPRTRHNSYFPSNSVNGDAIWDNRFMNLALHISSWSKDRSVGVGCVIVGPDKEVRSTGFNGLPRGCDDNDDERQERPLKYKWFEHAERNAIFNAARIGVSLNDCTAYVPWFPCVDCTRAIIQSGISRIVALEPDFDNDTWGEDFKISVQMISEAGLVLDYLNVDSSV